MKIERKIRLMDAAVLAVGSFALWIIVPWMGIAGWVLAAALALKALLNIADTIPEPAWKIAVKMEDKKIADDFDPADSPTHSWSTVHGWRWNNRRR